MAAQVTKLFRYFGNSPPNLLRSVFKQTSPNRSAGVPSVFPHGNCFSKVCSQSKKLLVTLRKTQFLTTFAVPLMQNRLINFCKSDPDIGGEYSSKSLACEKIKSGRFYLLLTNGKDFCRNNNRDAMFL